MVFMKKKNSFTPSQSTLKYGFGNRPWVTGLLIKIVSISKLFNNKNTISPNVVSEHKKPDHFYMNFRSWRECKNPAPRKKKKGSETTFHFNFDHPWKLKCRLLIIRIVRFWSFQFAQKEYWQIARTITKEKVNLKKNMKSEKTYWT